MSYVSTKKLILATLLAIGSFNVHGMEAAFDGGGEESSEERGQEDNYIKWWHMPQPEWKGSANDYKVWWKQVGQFLFHHEIMDGIPVPSLNAIFTAIINCEKEVAQMLTLNRGDFLRYKDIGDADISVTIANLMKYQSFINLYGKDNIKDCMFIQEIFLPKLKGYLKEPFIAVTKSVLMKNNLINFNDISPTLFDSSLEPLLNLIFKTKVMYIKSEDDLKAIFNLNKLIKEIPEGNRGEITRKIQEYIQKISIKNNTISKSTIDKHTYLFHIHSITAGLIELIDKIMSTDTARSLGLTKGYLHALIGLKDNPEGAIDTSQFPKCPTLEAMRNFKKPESKDEELDSRKKLRRSKSSKDGGNTQKVRSRNKPGNIQQEENAENTSSATTTTISERTDAEEEKELRSRQLEKSQSKHHSRSKSRNPKSSSAVNSQPITTTTTTTQAEGAESAEEK